MQVVLNDGGRADAGYKGLAGDCGCRAVAIATELPYQEVYDLINEASKAERITKRNRTKSSARNGVHRKTLNVVLDALGWEWVPTMKIGSGCTVHLDESELPSGRLIVRVSRHFIAVIDGVIHDTHDPQRVTIEVKDFTERIIRRCVYGYWIKREEKI